MDDAVLPEEIIFSILTLVQAKSLLRFTCVCKRFYTIILNDPKFARSQLKAAHELKTLTHRLLLFTKDPNHDDILVPKSLDMDTLSSSSHIRKMKKLFRIVRAQCLGSSNGIIFLALNSHKFCMWNPSIRFLKALPKLDLAPGKVIIYYGVGYLPATDDYKLFIYTADRRISVEEKLSTTSITMFSTRNNAWKCLQVPEECRLIMQELGILSNEALHWLAFHNDLIVAIDLADENYRTMSLPKLADEEDRGRDASGYFNHLGVSADGCCLRLARVSWTAYDFVKVWEMKEYNVSSSWTKLFNLESLDPPRALYSSISVLLVGSSILLGEPYKRNYFVENELIRIDLKQGGNNGTYKIVGYPTSMIPYQETLIRIT